MLTADELEARRARIEGSKDLTALARRLRTHGHEVVGRNPAIPGIKGMLTADGGLCPACGGPLRFDPWSPTRHACSRCDAHATGERADAWWAWHQHLWLGERIASLATVGLLGDDQELIDWAAAKALEYAERYHDFPNADNVLGPSRLFFSTYLESIWLTRYLAGAFLLREAGVLDEDALAAVSGLIEEAANLIGEFDEGASNRQVWHNAALAATAAWFEDEDLARRALEGPRGLVGALADGFGTDGMWFEGENYHLFALQGLLVGSGWARLAGIDFFGEDESAARLEAALRAPIRSALPDGTFPARKDARFGVSLAQPMYLELWEAGVGGLLEAGRLTAAVEVAGWLRRLYALPAPPAETFDSWLEEADAPRPDWRNRCELSWWALLTMAPELPPGGDVALTSTLLKEEGLAVLRVDGTYASLDCGLESGGHGHPDRLHLTLHSAGVHWLADPGTGSYVSPDLFWYRSTLAHNAPRLEGRSQPGGDARTEQFDATERWAWARGTYGGFARTVVAGRTQLVDVLEFAAEEERMVELPWHPFGEVTITSPGRWEAATLDDVFAKNAERFVPAEPGPILWTAVEGAQTLHGAFDGSGELLRATAPGRPGEGRERSFLLRRARARFVRFATVLDWGEAPPRTITFTPGEVAVVTSSGATTHREVSDGWEITDAEGTVTLRGQQRHLLQAALDIPTPTGPARWEPPVAPVPHLPDPPPLDGTLAGFPAEPVILLDHDDQYRRSEEPYPGLDAFSAEAFLGWDEEALYVAVRVRKDPLVFRAPDAPPLRLDNEPDLIHADGIQVYLAPEGGPVAGWLAAPDPRSDAVSVLPVASTAARPGQAEGRWSEADGGYVVTLRIRPDPWPPGPADEPPRFDLAVNEMRPGRMRRMGQLAWTGGGGWVYLRGDRHSPGRLGRLRLT
jgi:hypothetical protein